MKIRDYASRFQCGISEETIQAGEYLEARGQTLCVEFGFKNAETKAGEKILEENGVK